MSLIQIPTLTEANISTYLSGLSSVNYPVFKSFSVDDFSIPCVLVKAGKFTQIESNSGVFEGTVAVSIITQINDVTETIQTHDDVTGAVYDAMESQDLYTSFNALGNLWNLDLSSIDQTKEERSLISILEYSASVQNLTLD